jgi:hypothetical protein
MTALRISTSALPAKQLIEDAIEAHGPSRVLIAAALALLRRRPKPRTRPPDLADLDPHLRRDIGLPVEPAPTSPYRLMLR